jgi:hypothetical protein
MFAREQQNPAARRPLHNDVIFPVVSDNIAQPFTQEVSCGTAA